MFKRSIRMTFLCVFIFTQVGYTYPSGNSQLSPFSAKQTNVHDLEKALNDGGISRDQKEELHQEYVDKMLTRLYGRKKVRPLIDDIKMRKQLPWVAQYLFGERGLNITNPAVGELFTWLVEKSDARAVYATEEEWPVRGHASNYGERKARLHVRVGDNDDVGAVFLHEFAALLGKDNSFNSRFEKDFVRWRDDNLLWRMTGGRKSRKKVLTDEFKDARLNEDLKGLVTRDFSYSWQRSSAYPTGPETTVLPDKIAVRPIHASQ